MTAGKLPRFSFLMSAKYPFPHIPGNDDNVFQRIVGILAEIMIGNIHDNLKICQFSFIFYHIRRNMSTGKKLKEKDNLDFTRLYGGDII
jgi:hypothetical protein